MRRAEIEPFKFIEGHGPLIVSMPHVGTYIPPQIKKNMTPEALQLPDTDWHLEKLYNFLESLGVSVLIATHSRYVIDLNRGLEDQSLYPGEDVTGLVPITTFDHELIYLEGKEPNDAELKARESFWDPYHNKLSGELNKIKTKHGKVILWDAHSIKSKVPRFFKVQLPDFNFGTNSGSTEKLGLGEQLISHVEGYTKVLNGRFTGGFITRNYGNPDNNIHSVQLELSQVNYMEEEYPFNFNEDLAKKLRTQLKKLIMTAMEVVT